MPAAAAEKKSRGTTFQANTLYAYACIHKCAHKCVGHLHTYIHISDYFPARKYVHNLLVSSGGASQIGMFSLRLSKVFPAYFPHYSLEASALALAKSLTINWLKFKIN